MTEVLSKCKLSCAIIFLVSIILVIIKFLRKYGWLSTPEGVTAKGLNIIRSNESNVKSI